MMVLKGSKTEANLKAAFAGESMARNRYEAFARRCDEVGATEAAEAFRAAQLGEVGHALGHLRRIGYDPANGMPTDTARQMLEAAIAGETHEYTEMYPEMAGTAIGEGFVEIAEWFQVLAKAEQFHAERFQKALDALSNG